MNATTGNNDRKNADDLLAHVVKIVVAYVGNNQVGIDELPRLIDMVHQNLSQVGTISQWVSDKLEPVVPVSESVFPDYIVCLEDGKKLKMLKRHLRTSYGLSPDEYRRKWGLPSDYPMVSPNYAKHRQKLAKKIGLGKR